VGGIEEHGMNANDWLAFVCLVAVLATLALL